MLVILGRIVVIGSILLGFTMSGGNIAALIHLSEFITIGGASLGGLCVKWDDTAEDLLTDN